MKGLFLLITLCLSLNLIAVEERTIHMSGQTGKTWMDYSSSTEHNLKHLLEILGRSSTGERLIKEARAKAARTGLTLLDVIKVGESSLTDTTLVRKFSPQSPEHVIYESKSVVYLSRHLAWDDALLDLSHELTHFIYREAFNPYADSFNAKDFIRSTIEGSGGEVQAFMTECRVLRELFSKRVQSRSHCLKIEDQDGRPSFARAVEMFYHIGDYYEKFHKQLVKRNINSSFLDLKSEKINFISSAYGVPYPMAALMEFDQVVEKVCENDKKRLAYMQQESKKVDDGRAPASVSSEKEKFMQSYLVRCASK